MSTEQTLETINLQLFDPFGENNLVTPQHIIEENNTISSKPTKSPRLPKVVKPKFIISGDLKKRLNKLIKESTNENAINIAQSLLALKHDTSGYNYLGLSNSDYSKISYLDSARIEKFKDDSSTELVLDSNSQVYKSWVDWQGNSRLIKVPIYNRNIKKPFFLSTLKEVLEEGNIGDRLQSNLENKQNDFKSGSKKAFIEVEGEKLYSMNAYVAKFDTDYFQSMIQEESSRSCSKVLYNGRNMHITVGSLSYANKKYAEFVDYGHQDIFIKPTVVQKSKLWDSKIRYHTKVGKIVRKLFQNQFNDVEVTDFSEEYQRLIVINKVGSSYVEASGEEIKHYYLDDNAKSSGPLGNSCMRYQKCQGYFGIYTDNDFCKLAVLKSRNLVAARALLWKINGTTYYDRIYHADNDSSFLLENILKEKGYIKIYGSSEHFDIPLSISKYLNYGLYPYMDTFCYYDFENECLVNYEPAGKHYQMRNTGGSFNEITRGEFCCYSCDEQTHVDDLMTITYGDACGEDVCSDCGCWTARDEVILNNDAVRAYNDDYYHFDDVVELRDGEYAYTNDRNLREYKNGYGYFILFENEYEEIDGDYYHLSDPELLNLKENQNN